MENPYSAVTRFKKANLTPAQESIKNAYIELCKIYPYASISITELCKKANVARTTFYATYPNSDALLEEIEDSLIYEFLKQGEKIYSDVNDVYIKESFKLVDLHRDCLKLFLVDRPDYRFIAKWKNAMKYHLHDSAVKRVDKKNVGLAMELFSSMVIAGFGYYLVHPNELDLDKLSLAATRVMEDLTK